MEVTLRSFEEDDVPTLEQWGRAIRSERFMSRYRPKCAAAGSRNAPNPLWFVVELDATPVGTTWFERGDAADVFALGILLGDPLLFGRGIGRRAIELAVERLKMMENAARITSNVRVNNPRAIACYARCGFAITGELAEQLADGVQVQYHTMIRELT
jgi:RimJ/RimL family protein N-acetyltransferase